MQTFLKLFNKFLSINKQALQSRMDLYVNSKNPSSPADLERILKEYDQFVSKGGMYS
jgi:hypothetical protein